MTPAPSDSDRALAEPQGPLSDAAINYAKSETVSSLLKVEAAYIAGAQWQRKQDQAEIDRLNFLLEESQRLAELQFKYGRSK